MATGGSRRQRNACALAGDEQPAMSAIGSNRRPWNTTTEIGATGEQQAQHQSTAHGQALHESNRRRRSLTTTKGL